MLGVGITPVLKRGSAERQTQTHTDTQISMQVQQETHTHDPHDPRLWLGWVNANHDCYTFHDFRDS